MRGSARVRERVLLVMLSLARVSKCGECFERTLNILAHERAATFLNSNSFCTSKAPLASGRVQAKQFFHLHGDTSHSKQTRMSSKWSDPACRIALAGVRCFLDLVTDRDGIDNQLDIFFSISLPVSLAFFSIMIGDILAFHTFRSKQVVVGVNRSVLALLNGCEAWQMISMCQLEESRPLAQLFVCIFWVFVTAVIPEKFHLQWLPAAFMLVVIACDLLNFKHQPSGFAVSLYAFVAFSCAVTDSKFVKYFVHVCIISIDFYQHDCVLSGMILMVAVSRIGVAMSYNAELSAGLPVPCMP